MAARLLSDAELDYYLDAALLQHCCPRSRCQAIIDMLVKVPSLRAARSEIAPVLQSRRYDYFL